MYWILAFSIHYWIVFLETLVIRIVEDNHCDLSVSTIGSYFLKLGKFSTDPSHPFAFSIHYWIVFLETWTNGGGRTTLRGFQYPLLDRISWNPIPPRWGTRQTPLSVSTIGSYFLKHDNGAQEQARPRHFQYPLLDRISWNVCQVLPNWQISVFQYPLLDRISWNFACRNWLSNLRRDLSVSTIGSYFLKLNSELLTSLWKIKLSVSTIGSYFLKLVISQSASAFLDLSVSTNGSYFLKRVSVCRANSRGGPFSIHYWIVFLETRKARRKCCGCRCFQYPLLDRISWNPAQTAVRDVDLTLSVSTIGSYFLKPTSSISSDLPVPAFSIHYWIVFLETPQRMPWRPSPAVFQYPLLDRISWNALRAGMAVPGLRLSVSTIGSYFLKRDDHWQQFRCQCLSVSTIGSYFLKQQPGAVALPLSLSFSIHYWIVFLET